MTPRRIDESSARAILEFTRREGRVVVSMYAQIDSEQLDIVRGGWFSERFRVSTTSYSADPLDRQGAKTTAEDMVSCLTTIARLSPSANKRYAT